jgi:hypothetical protein
MTRALRLTDFVLLGCRFEIVGEVADRAAEVAPRSDTVVSIELSEPAAGDQTGEGEDSKEDPLGLGIPGLELRYSTSEEDDEFVFVLRLELADPSEPYRLELVTGSRFDIPDPAVTVQQAEATLLFISYPYVRELVSNITGRTPYQQFELPPLTKLPHPRVTGEVKPADEEQEPAAE